MITLSVVLPCYNVSKYITYCLDSIFANETINSEILLINDGSLDNLGGVLNKYFDRQDCEKNCDFFYDQAYIHIIHQNNQGVSAARNKGIKEASGDYIVFIDPDDTIKPNYFSSIRADLNTINIEEATDVLIMGFDQIYKDQQGKTKRSLTRMPIHLYTTTSVQNTVKEILPYYLGYSSQDIHTWAKGSASLEELLEWGSVWRNAYRRKFLIDNQIWFNQSIKLNEDGMFNARCFSIARKVNTLMKSYYCYVVRTTGAMSANRVSLIDNKLALLKERDEISRGLRERGFQTSIEAYAGSCVMSALELIIKMPRKSFVQIKEYTRNTSVQEAVGKIGYTKNKKINVGIFILKYKMEYLASFAINVLNKMGIMIRL